MRTTMIEYDDEFINLVDNFLKSSREIRTAAEMCEDDPIKQDMVAHLAKEFGEIFQRSEALQTLIKVDYEKNRTYILQELREITVLNYEIASGIRKKLSPLVWN